MLEVKLVPMRG